MYIKKIANTFSVQYSKGEFFNTDKKNFGENEKNIQQVQS